MIEVAHSIVADLYNGSVLQHIFIATNLVPLKKK